MRSVPLSRCSLGLHIRGWGLSTCGEFHTAWTAHELCGVSVLRLSTLCHEIWQRLFFHNAAQRSAVFKTRRFSRRAIGSSGYDYIYVRLWIYIHVSQHSQRRTEKSRLSTAWHEGPGTWYIHQGFFCMFGALASMERGETTISFDFDIPYFLIPESSSLPNEPLGEPTLVPTCVYDGEEWTLLTMTGL